MRMIHFFSEILTEHVTQSSTLPQSIGGSSFWKAIISGEKTGKFGIRQMPSFVFERIASSIISLQKIKKKSF